MKVLISFCNPQLESINKNLLILDLKNEKSEYLLETKDGLTGITQDNNFFYALSQDSKIYIIDRNSHKLILNKKLENLLDPHSLFIEGDELFIVSTGNNEILKYKISKDRLGIDFAEVFWKHYAVNNEIGDIYHINSIFKEKKSIYITAFGLKDGDRWSSAKNGHIFNITENKKEINNIYHPHSLFIKDGKKYYCESASQAIKEGNNVIVKLKSGYVRGLSLDKKYLIFGVSGGRKISKSTGILNEVAETGLMEANCKILVFKKKLFFGGYKTMKEFNFFPNHTEIYDILIIDK
ncbi:MAG: DUF4915 domain-containing protein [Candidatus Moranbacteria bacterium]|jgi:hypothetical protein|nr:DUF4915 domain-containing protein [Candidatus Moranbacteria bacterium]